MLALELVLLKKLVFELSFHASLGPFVSPAIGRLRERLTAMLAFEWPDVEVEARVVQSARQASERLLTLFTGQNLIQLACARIFSITTSYQTLLLQPLLALCFLLSLCTFDRLNFLQYP